MGQEELNGLSHDQNIVNGLNVTDPTECMRALTDPSTSGLIASIRPMSRSDHLPGVEIVDPSKSALSKTDPVKDIFGQTVKNLFEQSKNPGSNPRQPEGFTYTQSRPGRSSLEDATDPTKWPSAREQQQNREQSNDVPGVKKDRTADEIIRDMDDLRRMRNRYSDQGFEKLLKELEDSYKREPNPFYRPGESARRNQDQPMVPLRQPGERVGPFQMVGPASDLDRKPKSGGINPDLMELTDPGVWRDRSRERRNQ
ncbi:MAG: hypothetical protein K2Z81_20135 [Cyanobacteria bacterium]|nr:hypothetical protein [Cyanobacteriota bacterium]